MSMFTQYFFKRNILKEIEKSNKSQGELKKELENLKELLKNRIKEDKEVNKEEEKKEKKEEENKESLSNIQRLRNPNSLFTRAISSQNRKIHDNFYQQTVKKLENIRNIHIFPKQESKKVSKLQSQVEYLLWKDHVSLSPKILEDGNSLPHINANMDQNQFVPPPSLMIPNLNKFVSQIPMIFTDQPPRSIERSRNYQIREEDDLKLLP